MKIQNISNIQQRRQINFQHLRYIPGVYSSSVLLRHKDPNGFIDSIDRAGESIKDLKFTHLIMESDFHKCHIVVSNIENPVLDSEDYYPPYNFEVVSPTQIHFINGDKTFDYPDNRSMEESFKRLQKVSKEFEGPVTENILEGYCELAKQIDKQIISEVREIASKSVSEYNKVLVLGDDVDTCIGTLSENIRNLNNVYNAGNIPIPYLLSAESYSEYEKRTRKIEWEELIEPISRNMAFRNINNMGKNIQEMQNKENMLKYLHNL